MNITRFERAVLWLLPIIVLAGILILRPHWGLMDDATNIYVLVPHTEAGGVLRYSWTWGFGDIAWGMFRPTYPLLCWIIYKPGMLFGSTVTFLWNALLSLLAIWYTARTFSRILGLRLAEVLIVNGAFFYQYDLFQHPSLQEKLVIAAGSAFVSACWDARSVKGWGRILFWFFLGLATKSSFMIYVCLGFWAFASAREKELFSFRILRPWLETGALGILCASLLAFYAYISLHGSYTAHGMKAPMAPNLLTIYGAMLLLPVASFFAAVPFQGAWRREGVRIFLPALGVLAFVAIFARWGIGGYVESLIGTLYACLLLQNAHLYFSRLPRALWFVPVSVLAILVCGYRTFGSMGRLHDLGAILDQGPALAQAGVKELWMPCSEGAQSMQRYFDHREGNVLQVHEAFASTDPEGKVFVYDRALCPFVGKGDAPIGCTAEPLWTGVWSHSFRVASMHCALK